MLYNNNVRKRKCFVYEEVLNMTWEERNAIIKENEPKFKNIFERCETGFAILQLPIEVPYKFRGLEDVEEILNREPTREDYEILYAKNEEYGMWKEADFIPVANMLWIKFNEGNYPTDYLGTSMSVSDVVLVKIKGTVKALYVDSFGFKELKNFHI